jgi:hypothetical protein
MPVPKCYAGIGPDPLALPVGSARRHVIARVQQLFPVNRVGGVMVGLNAVDAAHIRR